MGLKARSTLTIAACCVALGAIAGSLAMAQPGKDNKSAPAGHAPAAAGGQPDMQLPPGWSAEDMQACIAAGTPGKMHEWLGTHAGVWNGKTQMFMAPGAEAMKSDCVQTITSIMDGRYVKGEMKGDMPGMGPFSGLGFTGFDNVSQKFVGTWLDNHSTGIMSGVGELSKDGKTMNWVFTFNCPIAKKPITMRQVETYPDANTMTFDMFTTDPKSGKEYQCMRIDFTRAK